MKQLSHNTVSWIMLVVGGGGYVALLVISSDEVVGALVVMAGIVVFLLFRKLSPARCRARRRQAGLCPLCAYDLKHDFSTGCSECGWERA